MHRIIDDDHLRARGGRARLLHVCCTACRTPAFVYQKDGDGPMLRCYVDRILDPPTLTEPMAGIAHPDALPPLNCRECGQRLGEPVAHDAGRLAYRMRTGAFWAGPEPSPPDPRELARRIATERRIDDALLLRALGRARASMTPLTSAVSVVEGGYRRLVRVTRVGSGPLETAAGHCLQVEFLTSDHWGRCTALVFGALDAEGGLAPEAGPVPVRVDSGCASGQLFGDITCDCAQQLAGAMGAMAQRGQGIVLHVSSQDGRGFGAAFKLASLRLQEEAGIDTVEAAELLTLGASFDQRTYAGAVAVLWMLGVRQERPLQLLSNNPAKADPFTQNGYDVTLAPLDVASGPAATRHLEAKRRKLGHLGAAPRGCEPGSPRRSAM